MTLASLDLSRQAQHFADDLATLLGGVLPNAPAIEAVGHKDRYIIRPVAELGSVRGAALSIAGARLATLELTIQCCLDARAQWLAVHSSSCVLKADVDRTPVLRFDYQRRMNTAPHAHIQLHAHRGALSHLLSKANHSSPHDMSSLHIPVGGSRFRPTVEDMLQFLISECHFDAVDGWLKNIERGRERWRRTQIASVVRDVPSEAVRVLEELGYVVQSPSKAPEDREKALTAW